MSRREMVMDRKKRIALVAHDNMKGELLEWARFNERMLAEHELCAIEPIIKVATLAVAIGGENLLYRKMPIPMKRRRDDG